MIGKKEKKSDFPQKYEMWILNIFDMMSSPEYDSDSHAL